MDKGEAIVALDALGIDAVADAIVDGKTLTAIARAVGCARSSLLSWVAADKDRSQRVNDARRMAAAAFDEMAEEALLDAKDAVEVTRARELASHYRWRAAKMNVREYGDKVGVALDARIETNSDADPHEVARRVAFILARADHNLREEAAAAPALLTHTPLPPPQPRQQDYWRDPPTPPAPRAPDQTFYRVGTPQAEAEPVIDISHRAMGLEPPRRVDQGAENRRFERRGR